MEKKKKIDFSNHSLGSVERKLREAAARLPEPEFANQKFKDQGAWIQSTGKRKSWETERNQEPGGSKVHVPLWRAAVLALLLVCLGSTTVLAASPRFREAVIRFFTSGNLEQPPAEQQAGSLTMTQSMILDAHFRAMYVSSPDYVEILRRPSGELMLSASGEDGLHYYTVKDGLLSELATEYHRLTGTVDFGILPGVMTEEGAAPYDALVLPEMTFALEWQQSQQDIFLPASSELYGRRFDIGSEYGVDLGGDFDGMFSFSSIPGRTDLVKGTFDLDYQRTFYSYPFLVETDTGKVRDPLSEVDFSAYPCVTDLAFSEDLASATAMAGEDQEHLREVMIDLQTGVIEEVHTTPEGQALTPPTEDCFTWFVTGENTLFYAVGEIDDRLDGYLYDGVTGESTLLFEDAAWNYDVREEGYADRYIDLLGGGYGLYREEGKAYLLDLADGSRMLLEGVPMGHNVSFFFNREFTLLNYSVLNEAGETVRLGFIDPQREEAWYFDRSPEETIHESSFSWYDEYGYVISAANEAGDAWYLYLYEYMP